ANTFGAAALPARQAAHQHVEQEANPEALVRLLAPERENGAGWGAVEHPGVGGRPPLGVEEPPGGDGLALVEADADLALGRDGGAKVEHDGAFGGARGPRQAGGVGADAADGAAGRGDGAAEAVVVHRGHEGEALRRRGLGVLAQPADVPAVLERPRGDAYGSG